MSSEPSAPPLLCIDDVCVRFGGVKALNSVSFDIHAGQICGLIGPNGAGKTTLFNVLSRLYRCQGGSITFNGRSLWEVPIHGIAALGIGRTFQNLALFRSMTVCENVMLGAHSLARAGYFGSMLQLPSVRREEREVAAKVEALMRKLGLDAVANTQVDRLPFGTLKRVELARALASKPSLLLLDEPAGGLNHDEVEQLRQLILSIRDEFDLTILLVEHHMNLVMRVSDKVVALDFGQKIADGTPSELQNDEKVISAYLGRVD